MLDRTNSWYFRFCNLAMIHKGKTGETVILHPNEDLHCRVALLFC